MNYDYFRFLIDNYNGKFNTSLRVVVWIIELWFFTKTHYTYTVKVLKIGRVLRAMQL